MTIETTIIAALALLLGWSVQRAQSWRKKAIDYKMERNAAVNELSSHHPVVEARYEELRVSLDRICHVLDAIAIQPVPPTKPRAVVSKPAAKKAAKKAASKKATKAARKAARK